MPDKIVLCAHCGKEMSLEEIKSSEFSIIDICFECKDNIKKRQNEMWTNKTPMKG